MPDSIQIGDVVWAKMPSYPLWPAIVIYPVPQVTAPYIGDESQHFVKFYGPGTNLCSWIPDKHIFPHSPKLMKEGKNKKSKKLLSAIAELEEHLRSEGLVVETQDEETGKKRKYKKRKRNQAAVKVKNKKTRVSGNKEINDTDGDIEDHNLYDNQKEIDKYRQMQAKEPALDGLQGQDENDKSHKIQDKVDEHPKVLPNKDCVAKGDTEIENQCVQQLEIEQVIPIKVCVSEKDSISPTKKRKQEAIKAKLKITKVSSNKEINDTDVVIEDHNLYDNQEEIEKCHQMQEKDKVDEHPKVLPNKGCVVEDDMEIENQCIQQVEIEQVIPIKDCVTEKGSTSPEQRDQEAIKAKNENTKVSGNEDINDTDVVIEDHNLYKNQKEIDKYEQMPEKEPALDCLQMQKELDKSYKIDDYDKVEYPKVSPNKDCVTEEDMEIENDCIQQVEMKQTIPVKDCVPEDSMEIENQCVQQFEVEQAIPNKVCVTEKDSTSPEQTIDTTMKLLFSDEILLNEFWKSRSGKKQALEHLQKIIEVLKDEIEEEEGLKIQKCDMQPQCRVEEGNKDPNLHQTDKFDEAQKMPIQQGNVIEHSKVLINEEKEDNEGVMCVPEMRANEQPVLSTKDQTAEKKSSPSELSTNEAVEPIIYSTEAVAGEFFETAIRNGQFATSSENEFRENVITPVRPNDSDTLHFKSSQMGLNIMPQVLPSLNKPFGVLNDTNINKSGLFSKYLLLPSSVRPLKFGFMGNGFLKRIILKKLIMNKFNVTLLTDTSVEENEEAYYTSGAKKVRTFQALVENCDIIFSYWEDAKTVKFQLSQVLCSVPTGAFFNKGYVELSTLDPETAYSCGLAVNSNGGRFLEAALLDAENGDLVVLASGDRNLFDECRSPFRAVSKFQYYFNGEIGRGSVMKVAYSMLQGTALAGLAEVVALVRSNGFSEDDFTGILNVTPFQHGFWFEKARLMFRDIRTSFRPADDQRRKDFYYGLKLALRLKLPTWTCWGASHFFEHNR